MEVFSSGRANVITSRLTTTKVFSNPWSMEEYEPLEDNGGILEIAKFRKDIIYKNNFDKFYVSDNMKDLHMSWNENQKILISAQTGAGKNTYVEDVIIPHYTRNNKKVIVLSNRVALSTQTKKRLAKKYKVQDKLKNYSESGLNIFTEIGNIIILSYHQILNHLNNSNFKEKCDDISCVVVDECHFFKADSTFNPTTNLILSRICEVFKDKTMLFMTATPYEVVSNIYDKSLRLNGNVQAEDLGQEDNDYYDNYREISSDQSIFSKSFLNNKFLIYDMPKSFDQYKFSYFQDESDLVDIVISSTEKFLIFVDSSILGERLRNSINSILSKSSENEKNKSFFDENTESIYSKLDDIFSNYSENLDENTRNKLSECLKDSLKVSISNITNDNAKNNAVFINSATKNNTKVNPDTEAYNEIVNDQSFKNRVVISTSALDNGINIIDSNTKNIVIYSSDRTQFLQMLGRKRKEEGEVISVYIKVPSSQDLSQKIKYISDRLICYDALKEEDLKKVRDLKVRNILSTDIELELTYPYDGNNRVNPYAYDTLTESKQHLENLKSFIADKNYEGYINYFFRYLKIPHTFSMENFIDHGYLENTKKELFEYLDQYTTNSEDPDRFIENPDAFKKSVTEFLHKLKYTSQNENKVKESYGWNLINKAFTSLEFDYTLQAKSGKWYVVKN